MNEGKRRRSFGPCVHVCQSEFRSPACKTDVSLRHFIRHGFAYRLFFRAIKRKCSHLLFIVFRPRQEKQGIAYSPPVFYPKKVRTIQRKMVFSRRGSALLSFSFLSADCLAPVFQYSVLEAHCLASRIVFENYFYAFKSERVFTI